MKYGESTFDILYLLFAIISGCVIMIKAKNRVGRLMGLSALILGLGDAFHLVPRVLNYFSSRDMTAALGIGKLVTSVTMTVFYLLLYYVWLGFYGEAKSKGMTAFVWTLTAVRVALCLLPQNEWLKNSADATWGMIRNIPFVILGATVCLLFLRSREKGKVLKNLWIYILLSFAFYIPVTVGAGALPVLGMLMLPKTVCYILMIVAFISATSERDRQPGKNAI